MRKGCRKKPELKPSIAQMRLLVTSASGTNGHGYGKLLAFDLSGRALGTFSDESRVAEPRGCVPQFPSFRIKDLRAALSPSKFRVRFEAPMLTVGVKRCQKLRN